MEVDDRVLSPAQHRTRAERLRKLAAEATTTRAKEHLLAQASEREALANGRGIVARSAGEDERADIMRRRLRR